MSEARKFHLNLIVANQFTTQLTQEIRDAVFGNMGTIVAFRVGQQDVEVLAKYFQPAFDEEDLLRVPNYNSIVRTLVGGVPTNPFSMSTLPPLGSPNPKLADALKQLSAAKYGRPKGEVEKEIFARMSVAAPAIPAGGFGAPGGPAAGGVGVPGGAYAAPGAAPQVPQAAGWGSAGVTARPGTAANPPGFATGAPVAGPAYGGVAPAYGAPVGGSPAMAPVTPGSVPAVNPAPANASFLDDWLNKRSVTQPPAAAAPAPIAGGPASAATGSLSASLPAVNGLPAQPGTSPGAGSSPDAGGGTVELKPKEAADHTGGELRISKDEASDEIAQAGMPVNGENPQEITIDENGVLQNQQSAK
jgi:hypothetical protein